MFWLSAATRVRASWTTPTAPPTQTRIPSNNPRLAGSPGLGLGLGLPPQSPSPNRFRSAPVAGPWPPPPQPRSSHRAPSPPSSGQDTRPMAPYAALTCAGAAASRWWPYKRARRSRRRCRPRPPRRRMSPRPSNGLFKDNPFEGRPFACGNWHEAILHYALEVSIMSSIFCCKGQRIFCL